MLLLGFSVLVDRMTGYISTLSNLIYLHHPADFTTAVREAYPAVHFHSFALRLKKVHKGLCYVVGLSYQVT